MTPLQDQFQDYDSITIGYARVSTDLQELGLLVQTDKLSHCDMVFLEKESGAKADRKKYHKAIRLAKTLSKQGKSVTLTVYKLDRLTRRMGELLKIIEELNQHHIKLVSLYEQLETDSLTGQLLCLVLGYVAEMELNAIRSRTKDGLQKAKEKGVKLGNQGLHPKLEQEIIRLYIKDRLPIKEIAQTCQVALATIYNVLKRHQIPTNRRKTCHIT